MCDRHTFNGAGLLLVISLLTACGPGGGNSGDVFPRETQTSAAVTGPNSFLLFPNPQKQDDGSLQTNTNAYATAYYEAIDPNNDKDTLVKWKSANGFGSGTGTEVTVVFGDVKDLGYGRRMTARQNTDGSLAFVVENYLVGAVASYSYSDLNVEAAVVQDKRWHVGTNGIEFSSASCITGVDLPASAVAATGYCSTTTKFAKFFTFDPTSGQRLLEAQLDGRGKKAMPGICINCHGGRGDPLTPAAGSANGKQLFNLVHNTVSQKRGDVMANLQPLKVDSFGYSSRVGYSRAEQEANLKTINKMVLSSYPIATPLPACLTAPVTCPEDSLRRTPIGSGEWPGTAAALIKNAYGGNGLPYASFSDTYLPTGWSGVGQTALYQGVVASSCRTCHILRGSDLMSEINFETYCTQTVPGTCDNGKHFFGYADRIKAHVIDRGNMPLAKIVYERLWSTTEADTLATFLGTAQSQPVRDSGGAVLKPGRPVAVPGPDRTTTSPATLSAAGSLYATSYSWSIFSTNGIGTVLSNSTSATPILTAANGSTNVLRLVVSNGTTQSDPVNVTVIIDNSLSPLPSAIRFSDIKAVLQDNVANCMNSCHYAGGGSPVLYTNYDRNGDSFIDATDDRWFYAELRGRINFTDITASPLLRKPSGQHHGGGLVFDASLTTPCTGTAVAPSCQPYATNGQYLAAKYKMFVNWILNGAPY